MVWKFHACETPNICWNAICLTRLQFRQEEFSSYYKNVLDGVGRPIFTYVTSVKLCHLLGYDDSLDRLFGFAQKRYTYEKKVSDHHCYFKIAVWGIPQLRANQSHVVSVIPCPIRSLFYPIIPPWHPHYIYICYPILKNMYHYNSWVMVSLKLPLSSIFTRTLRESRPRCNTTKVTAL